MLLTKQELNGGKEENPEDNEAKLNTALQDTRTDLCERWRGDTQLCCENRFLFVHQEESFGFTLCGTVSEERWTKLFDKWAESKTVFSGEAFWWQIHGVNVTAQNRWDLSSVKSSLRDLPAPLTPGTCVTAYKPGLVQQDVDKDLIPCIDFHENLLQPSLRTGLMGQRNPWCCSLSLRVEWDRGGGSGTPISHTTQLHLIIICFSQPEKKPTTRFVCLNPAGAEYFHTYVWIA